MSVSAEFPILRAGTILHLTDRSTRRFHSARARLPQVARTAQEAECIACRGRRSESEITDEMTHPSLKMPFVPPAALKPQRKMPRNSPCWCGSGKKWKKCHLGRASQPPIRLGKQMSRLYREFQKGYCSHPEASSDNCSDKIVRAHTIQRGGGIAAIAENGHVVSAKSAAQDLVKNCGAFVPREVGVRSASTFMGFCDKHDNSMFQSVEKRSVLLTRQSCFLFGFRALSYELFTKRAELRSMAMMRELDAGQSFAYQCQWQQEMNLREYGAKRALADCERWKNRYDKIFLHCQFEEYRFVGVSDFLTSVVLRWHDCGRRCRFWVGWGND